MDVRQRQGVGARRGTAPGGLVLTRVNARGNAVGADPVDFTTTREIDATGNLRTIIMEDRGLSVPARARFRTEVGRVFLRG